MIQRRIQVFGEVQGVGFRASLRGAASNFPNLRGYVKNLSDGSVEAVFCGEENMVLKMVAWCEKGPISAKVAFCQVTEEPVDPSLPSFRIQL